MSIMTKGLSSIQVQNVLILNDGWRTQKDTITKKNSIYTYLLSYT